MRQIPNIRWGSGHPWFSEQCQTEAERCKGIQVETVLSFCNIPACVHAQSCQLCPALFDPMDCSPPGFPVHGILQARILEWLAMPSSWQSSWCRDQTHASRVSFITGRVFTADSPVLCCAWPLSRVWLFATPWIVSRQAPPSTGILQARIGVGCPDLYQGIFPTQRSNPGLPPCRRILYH